MALYSRDVTPPVVYKLLPSFDYSEVMVAISLLFLELSTAKSNIGKVSFVKLLKKRCYVRGFKENIRIMYIKLKEIKFPIQILVPLEYIFILFKTK